MKQIYLSLFFLLSGFNIFAQSDIDKILSSKDGIIFINHDRIVADVGFPQIAKDVGIHGAVITRVRIDTAGRYEWHKIIESSHPILLEAVEKQIDKVRFSRVTLDGQFIPYYVNIPFDFSIPPGAPAPSILLSKKYLDEAEGKRPSKTTNY